MKNEKPKAPPQSDLIKKVAYHLIKEAEGEAVTLRRIKRVLAEDHAMQPTSGALSGAMRDLVKDKNGHVLNEKRGEYRYVGDVRSHQINRVLSKAIEELDQLAYVNILTASEMDLDVIRSIPEIQAQLEQLKLDTY